MTTTDENDRILRETLTRAMLSAISATWRAMDEGNTVRDEAHNREIVTQGCEELLAGRFNDHTDLVALGIACFTLARSHMLTSGMTFVWDVREAVS